ncbi:MAG: DUF1844 domain-containing protein [Candidatus Aureabacteria bacterium]|nr:DUF1844 domain-containing protein [Candidatus Auribacterota bacterium]
MDSNQEQKKEIQFIGFVSIFGNSAMQAMGKVANPFNGKIEKNMEAAKASIDLLELLEEKTKGNLTQNEQKALESLLTNLRLNYADEMKKPEKNEEKKEQDRK